MHAELSKLIITQDGRSLKKYIPTFLLKVLNVWGELKYITMHIVIYSTDVFVEVPDFIAHH